MTQTEKDILHFAAEMITNPDDILKSGYTEATANQLMTACLTGDWSQINQRMGGTR